MECLVQVDSIRLDGDPKGSDGDGLRRLLALLIETLLLAVPSWLLLHAVRLVFGVLLVLTRLRTAVGSGCAFRWGVEQEGGEAEPCEWQPLNAALVRSPLRLLGSMAIGPRCVSSRCDPRASSREGSMWSVQTSHISVSHAPNNALELGYHLGFRPRRNVRGG
jgi:hypothetical protein